MNQNERDALVDRYLAGQMSSGEESDFFLKVAVDPELQRTLKSYQIFDRVVERDREAVPAQGRYRGQIMALLAATKVATGGGAAAGLIHAQTAATAGAAGAGGAAVAGFIGLKGIIAAVIGVGVIGGTVAVIVPSNSALESGNGAGASAQKEMIVVPPEIQAPIPQSVAGSDELPLMDALPNGQESGPVARATESVDRKRGVLRQERGKASAMVARSAQIQKAPEFKMNDAIQLGPKASEMAKSPVLVQPEASIDGVSKQR